MPYKDEARERAYQKAYRRRPEVMESNRRRNRRRWHSDAEVRAKHTAYQAARRANETPEARERRLARERAYYARNRETLNAARRARYAANAARRGRPPRPTGPGMTVSLRKKAVDEWYDRFMALPEPGSGK